MVVFPVPPFWDSTAIASDMRRLYGRREVHGVA